MSSASFASAARCVVARLAWTLVLGRFVVPEPKHVRACVLRCVHNSVCVCVCHCDESCTYAHLRVIHSVSPPPGTLSPTPIFCLETFDCQPSVYGGRSLEVRAFVSALRMCAKHGVCAWELFFTHGRGVAKNTSRRHPVSKSSVF